jgi:hypothetical protein
MVKGKQHATEREPSLTTDHAKVKAAETVANAFNQTFFFLNY